ncbi:MAG: cytidine deaminase [Bacillota bacterium]
MISYDNLHKEADKVRKMAYAPFSGLKVGAALMVKSGKIYTGCNIENISYGLTMCAERVAIYKAISSGDKDIKKIYILADTDKPISPCGACRQVIREFGRNIIIIMSNLEKNRKKSNIKELLPAGFKKGDF